MGLGTFSSYLSPRGVLRFRVEGIGGGCTFTFSSCFSPRGVLRFDEEALGASLLSSEDALTRTKVKHEVRERRLSKSDGL